MGDFVLLLNSRMHLFLGKLKSKWTGTFLITYFSHMERLKLENKEGTNFTLNMQKIKIYQGNGESMHEVVEAYILDEV